MIKIISNVYYRNSYWKAIINDDKDEETDEVSEEE